METEFSKLLQGNSKFIFLEQFASELQNTCANIGYLGMLNLPSSPPKMSQEQSVSSTVVWKVAVEEEKITQ